MRTHFTTLLVVLGATCLPGVRSAGMPTVTVTLTKMAEIRLQNISFFLVGFFVSAFLIRLLWNYLQSQFTQLPRLSYRLALGVTLLWGLIFVLVLTMISGARELMTPAAWERDGRTFKVQDKPASDPTSLTATAKPSWRSCDLRSGIMPK